MNAIRFNGNIPNSLYKWVMANASVIDSVEHDEDGYWIILKDGYISTYMDCRTIHEPTITKLKYAFNQGIEVK